MFEMLHGFQLFKASNQFELVHVIEKVFITKQNKKNKKQKNLIKSIKINQNQSKTTIAISPHIKSQISSDCAELLLMLLNKDPNRRISWETFFQHSWLGFDTIATLPSPPLS